MRTDTVALVAILLLTPLGARAADLVVWWEKGYYAQEDDAVREIIAAFEQKTGKQVELVLEKWEHLRDDTSAAIEAGRRSPDFIFTVNGIQDRDQWAYEGRLVELTDAIGPMREMFSPGGGSYVPVTGNWRHGKVIQENVWEKAIHSVATGDLTAEQAVDEAIARVKQILAE